MPMSRDVTCHTQSGQNSKLQQLENKARQGTECSDRHPTLTAQSVLAMQ